MEFTQRWHPLLYDRLVSIPHLNPGDTIWWHPDLVIPRTAVLLHKMHSSDKMFFFRSTPLDKIIMAL